MEPFARLEKVFRMVFDDDAIVIRPEMTANDVEGWDSLSHVNLIVAVEEEFSIRFTQREVLAFRDIGDLYRCIQAKVAG
jgi:acyl carrier protein